MKCRSADGAAFLNKGKALPVYKVHGMIVRYYYFWGGYFT